RRCVGEHHAMSTSARRSLVAWLIHNGKYSFKGHPVRMAFNWRNSDCHCFQSHVFPRAPPEVPAVIFVAILLRTQSVASPPLSAYLHPSKETVTGCQSTEEAPARCASPFCGGAHSPRI